jgi:hypothetical protein
MVKGESIGCKNTRKVEKWRVKNKEGREGKSVTHPLLIGGLCV